MRKGRLAFNLGSPPFEQPKHKKGVQGLCPWWVGQSPTQSEVFARLFQKAVRSRGKAPGGFGQSPTSLS